MKIGLVSPYDWSYPGGVRDHVWHLAEQFISMGHDVRILAPASGIQGKKPEKYILKMGGTTPIPINGSIARINLDPSLSQRVRAVLQRERFDVIHIHEPLVPGLSQQVLRSSRTLTVGTFHTASYSNIYSTSQLAYASAYPLLRPLFYKLSGHIAVSTAARQFISRYFPADYRIIPNGISLERFGPGVLPLPHLMDGKRNILFLGRFEKRKGAKYLLRAIPAIRERHPHTRFIFVGEGRLRAGFQRSVERKGWQDVIFTGYVSDEDKPRYFTSAHIFCAPAIGAESLGIVLLEAMASGTPIVASDIKGYATVITHGVDGILTPPRQPDELADAISHLLGNEPLRQQFIQAGLVKAQAYAWTHVARSVMDYYCELLEARARAPLPYPRAL
jgi:phosphatidyl-myo-inositol alpha-mannosyltransferase